MHNNTTQLLTSKDLCSYFYNELEKINNKQTNPLGIEILQYCSDLLSEFSKVDKFFDEKDDKYHEKILGLSLLAANNLDSKNRFKKLKEVADTSIILCGYFVESIDRKILGVNYYKKVGIFTFLELDKISPAYMDHPSFFKNIASTYEYIIKTLQILRASQSPQDKKDILYFIPTLNNTGS